jgi:hypothetical protein
VKLGWQPCGTVLLLDGLDALLVSVEVAFVRSKAIGGRSSWSRPVSLTLACLIPPLHRIDDQHLHDIQGGSFQMFA